MSLRERLRNLADGLPLNGSVVFTRGDLEALLAEESGTVNLATLNRADYTVAEVADRFGRAPQTVRDWINDGKLDAYLFNEREYRITPAALAEFEEQRRNGKQAKPGPGKPADLGAWRNETRKPSVS